MITIIIYYIITMITIVLSSGQELVQLYLWGLFFLTSTQGWTMDWELSGWWYTYPSETYEVSWDDEIPNIWKKNHVPNHQPVMIMVIIY